MQISSLDPTPEPFVVFHVQGELDLDTQDEFEDAVTDRLGRSSVVVDLSGVEFLAISSLRSLMFCHLSARALHRDVVYTEASTQARRLLSVAGLDQVLDVRREGDVALPQCG